ncbi:uncharacterized protein LOC144095416 [Amblyomma americanum]
MSGGKLKVFFVALVAVLVEPLGTLGFRSTYPEARSDLQKYQDASRCYPDVGEWICMYRNYYSDPDFGGSAKCLKFQRYGIYENFTTPVVFTFGKNGSTNVTGTFVLTSSPCYTGRDLHNFTPDDAHFPVEDFYVIYFDCTSCAVIRHRYTDNGYGCSLWRKVGTFQEPNDCCEFIYDENCGSSPKYQVYDPDKCDF